MLATVCLSAGCTSKDGRDRAEAPLHTAIASYEIERSGDTQLIGVDNFFKPLNVSPPLGVYEVTGDKEKGGKAVTRQARGEAGPVMEATTAAAGA